MESTLGRPFVQHAPAGAELTRYCNGWRIPTRDSIYITNLVKEWEGGGKAKKQEVTPADVAREEWELQLEMMAVQPKVVAALGRHAARWFLGPDVDMDWCHGLVFRQWVCTLCGRTNCECLLSDGVTNTPVRLIYVVPVVHPAAGLHQPDMAARTAYDFDQLGTLLATPEHDRASLCWKVQAAGVSHYLEPHEAPTSIGFAEGIAVDTEGDKGAAWGYSISGDPEEAWVQKFPTPPSYGSTVLHGTVATSPMVRWTMHNAMHDLQVLAEEGIHIPDDRFDDTMVMAYLLGVEPQALKDLSRRHLGITQTTFEQLAITHEPVISAKTGKLLKQTKKVVHALDTLPLQSVVDYAGSDAICTRLLKPILWAKIVAAGLEQVYAHDISVLPMYARMETVGMPVSMDHMLAFGVYLQADLLFRTITMKAEWGEDFNPDAPAQVGEILFGKLKLPGGKKTPKSGQWGTNDKLLQALKTAHPFVQAIIDRREVAKLKSTFVDCLPKYVSGGRLRYRLLPTRVVSGRLAAKDPNVLALPKHSELGKRFRAGICAGPGRLLGSWDFNQIELRVLAVDSGSPSLLQMFRDGVDLHTRTAARIFNIPDDRSQQDDSLHRLPAKTTNFGIVMGMTEMGLAEQMRKNQYPWPELDGWADGDGASNPKAVLQAQAEVCRGWIETVAEEWQIKPYWSRMHAQARRLGYVTDIWGRRRYLPSVLSPNKQQREGALRQAQAFGPQAGARGVYKLAVARVWREVIRPLQAQGHYIEPLLDLHDDLLLEFDEVLGEMLKVVIRSYFETAVEWPIPVVCSAKVAQKWSDL